MASQYFAQRANLAGAGLWTQKDLSISPLHVYRANVITRRTEERLLQFDVREVTCVLGEKLEEAWLAFHAENRRVTEHANHRDRVTHVCANVNDGQIRILLLDLSRDAAQIYRVSGKFSPVKRKFVR